MILKEAQVYQNLVFHYKVVYQAKHFYLYNLNNNGVTLTSSL